MKMNKLPFAWRVSKNGATSYLVGTSHAEISDSVVQAAHSLVDEVDVVFEESVPGFGNGDGMSLEEGSITTLLQYGEVERIVSVVRKVWEEKMSHKTMFDALAKMRRIKLWGLNNILQRLDDIGDLLANRESQNELKRYESVVSAVDKIASSVPGVNVDNPYYNQMVRRAAELREQTVTYDADHKGGSSRTLDGEILVYSTEQGKRIDVLDTEEGHTACNDRVRVETQRTLLLKTLELLETGKFSFDDDIAAYERGDLEEMRRLMTDVGPAEAEYVEHVCDGRTLLWHPRTLPYFEQGNILVAAGVGHMVRDVSYVNLLEADGFTVERI